MYEVKEKYFPNADLEYLECKGDELSQEALTKMLSKIGHPISNQPTKES